MNEPSPKNEDAFAYSNTFFGTVCCLCICATIIFVAYHFETPQPQPAQRLWTPTLVDTNGDTTVFGSSRQLEFWTPSVKTKNYLHMEHGQAVPTEMWEVVSNDDVLEAFGMMLHTNTSALGYRRVEVWGQGRTIYKPGWWWTLDVHTNYTVTDFARTYEAFWKSHQIVFVEVVDNPGPDESQFQSAH